MAQTDISIEHCIHGPNAGIQRAPPIEAQPSRPYETGAQEHHRNVVRLLPVFVALVFRALAKNEGIS